MDTIKNNFSIKDLENITGVKAHTIRIWEKRYDLLSPERSETNIRYYSNKNLQKLLNIVLLNNNNYKISKISEMKDDAGTAIDPNKSYKVSGWAQVGSVGNGRLMWDVAADYLRKQGTLDLKKVNHPFIVYGHGKKGKQKNNIILLGNFFASSLGFFLLLPSPIWVWNRFHQLL